MAAVLFVMDVLYRKQMVTKPELQAEIMQMDETKSLKDRKLLARSLFVLGLTILGFFTHSFTHIESSVVALFGAFLLLLLAGGSQHDVDFSMRKVEWATIFFFIGLFVAVGGLSETGVIRDLATGAVALTEGDVTKTSLLVLWLSALVSSVLDNIPFVATMIPLIQNMGAMGVDNLEPVWWSLSLGACLGGNGTHKTANLLSQEGLNIIGLPKTIDNDIYGTDVTFGFHTAVDIATEVIDRIHTTAGSHSRVMCIEIMGNKAGWLTLYSGIAGGADIILLPEQPYDIDRVCSAVERRAKKGSNFSIIAVAEGAINCEEAGMKRKEWMAKRAEAGFGTTATNRIAQAVQKKTGMETRVCIPGHMQRGGSPSAYDRVLATQFGSYAAKLVEIKRYGVTVAMVNRHVTENRLADIAGKTRNVPENCDLLTVARRMGISLG